MLTSSSISSSPTVQKLVQTWSERYQTQISFSAQHFVIFDTLVHTVSEQGRQETAEKLHRSLVRLNCEFAATQAHELHKQVQSEASLSETKRIVQCAVEIYLTLLKFYQQSSSISAEALQSNSDDRELQTIGLSSEELLQLAALLEPLLLEYQDRHQVSQDWARIGFLTTHFNFSNAALLNNLTIAERIFLKPYFKFLEEQVALPWQRLCAAADSHTISSPAFQLVSAMLPHSEAIAQRVYLNLLRQFRTTTMRRGRLDHPGVQHSCIRDLNMFQAYLWLCVLQGSLAPVEDELVRLCTMVMPRVGVPWEMIVQWNEILMEAVLDRTSLSQQPILQPFMSGFIKAFQEAQEHFIEEP